MESVFKKFNYEVGKILGDLGEDEIQGIEPGNKEAK